MGRDEAFYRFVFRTAFQRALFDNIIISLLKMVSGFPFLIILSLMINEVRNSKAKKLVQTSVILHNFVSWVVVYSLGTGGDNMVIGGHLRVDLLYRNRELVDFLRGPFPYMENRDAHGVPMSRGLLESTRLRGMLWLTEMDQHPVGTEEDVGGDPARREETVAQLRRNILLPVLAGMGCWYYDHRIIHSLIRQDSRNSSAGSIFRKKGWWDQPELLREIGKLQRLAERYALRPYRPAADVLIVYDTESYFTRSKINEEEYALHEAVGRTGAAYDCIYLKELEIAELERCCCVIFPNAFLLTPQQREKIRRRVEGKQVIWLYAPGFSGGKTQGECHMAAVTGMKVKLIGPENACRTKGCLPACRVETNLRHDPLSAIDDAEADPVAYYEKSGACAAARKGNQWVLCASQDNSAHCEGDFPIGGGSLLLRRRRSGAGRCRAGCGQRAFRRRTGDRSPEREKGFLCASPPLLRRSLTPRRVSGCFR